MRRRTFLNSKKTGIKSPFDVYFSYLSKTGQFSATRIDASGERVKTNLTALENFFVLDTFETIQNKDAKGENFYSGPVADRNKLDINYNGEHYAGKYDREKISKMGLRLVKEVIGLTPEGELFSLSLKGFDLSWFINDTRKVDLFDTPVMRAASEGDTIENPADRTQDLLVLDFSFSAMKPAQEKLLNDNAEKIDKYVAWLDQYGIETNTEEAAPVSPAQAQPAEKMKEAYTGDEPEL